jgi:hypothetical protein
MGRSKSALTEELFLALGLASLAFGDATLETPSGTRQDEQSWPESGLVIRGHLERKKKKEVFASTYQAQRRRPISWSLALPTSGFKALLLELLTPDLQRYQTC